MKKQNATKSGNHTNTIGRRISESKARQAFETLSKAEQRIEIARDVLAQLKAKTLIAESGVWVNILSSNKYGNTSNSLFEMTEEKGHKNDKEVAEVLEKKKCRVCALGACFVSTVKKLDKLKMSDLENGQNDFAVLVKYLSKVFSKDQLKLIEVAFEEDGGQVSSDDVYNGQAASNFFENIVNSVNNDWNNWDDLKLRLIMENIIANKGLFKPSKKPIISYITPGYNS